MSFSGADLKPAFRLSRNSINMLVQMLPRQKAHGWSHEIEVLVTVYLLACGASYRAIHFRRTEEVEEVGAGFVRFAGHETSRCAASAIDGGALGEHRGDFVNRKSFHSINVQMTCDHQLMVTSVEAKWPGLVHDSRIFQESSLGHRFEQGHYDGLLLGDRGYPCTRFLMTPYPDPQTPPERCFNVALSKCRVRIEMTFEVIKSRFNCLRGLRVSPERACQITTACMVLHNIATMRKERAPHVPLVAPDIVDPITPDHPTGAAIRQAITNQFFM
ncbi:putative nuclease HARBI1 [Thunnus thynnus]|uniref:putative nuclease HARBI1 n=1 Tax=Thunnus thynnus TaxID=8237 RepID=UPI0035291EE3